MIENRFYERNSRGIIIIESFEYNLEIAFIPIGMVLIDSINILVKQNDMVKKGDCLGMFELGGSAVLVLISNTVNIEFINDNINYQNKSIDNTLDLAFSDSKKTKLHRLIGESVAKIN